MSKVDVLAVALFEAYSRNSGNPPDCHYDRNAAEQLMAQALNECGVAKLIEALSFYTAICGNTCAMVPRETAAEMYAKGTAALSNIGSTR